MAQRSAGPDEILTHKELAELQNRPSMMSTTAVQDFYRSAYFVCRIGPGHFPSARAIQELVQAWKQMRKWNDRISVIRGDAMPRRYESHRTTVRFMVSAFTLGVLLVMSLDARAESIEEAHARLLTGIGQVNFDPSKPENTRTIEAAWIVEAAQKQVDINIYGAVIRGPLLLPLPLSVRYS